MRVIRVGDVARHKDELREAAAALRGGGLVAFPTETVYGLGANALDARAVARIYEVKGRPPLNPVIVHVATEDQARGLSADWTPVASALAREFWPGPLTIVVRKAANIPPVVTAGGNTVGLRVPNHPVALALLREAGIPVAAPSANLSTQVSPTTAEHVIRGLGAAVDFVLDGGSTDVGIESTVVDATGAGARILRPGMIGADAIARATGTETLEVDSGAGHPAAGALPAMSPGLMDKHYAPSARVLLFASEQRDHAVAEAGREVASGGRVGAMVFAPLDAPGIENRVMPGTASQYARELYATLHAMDAARLTLVLVEMPPAKTEWKAILDRLRRAAG